MSLLVMIRLAEAERVNAGRLMKIADIIRA